MYIISTWQGCRVLPSKQNVMSWNWVEMVGRGGLLNLGWRSSSQILSFSIWVRSAFGVQNALLILVLSISMTLGRGSPFLLPLQAFAELHNQLKSRLLSTELSGACESEYQTLDDLERKERDYSDHIIDNVGFHFLLCNFLVTPTLPMTLG